MEFCSVRVLESPASCATVITIFVGALWVLVCEIAVLMNTRKDTSAELNEPLFSFSPPHGEADLSRFRFIIVRFLQVTAILQVFISMTSEFLRPQNCNYVGYYIGLGIQMICWGNIILRSKSICSKRPNVVSLLTASSVGWCFFQLISSGIVLTGLEFNSINNASSSLAVLHFLLTAFASCLIVLVLLNDDKKNVPSIRRDFAFDKSERFRPIIPSVSSEEGGSRNVSYDVQSLWLTRNPSVASGTTSDLADIREPADDAQESDSMGVRRDVDLGGVTISRTNRVVPFGQPISIAKSTSSLREQFLFHAGDVTVSVTNWGRIKIRDKIVIVYDLSLGEAIMARSPDAEGRTSRTIRTGRKRLDEIAYLREKIKGEFPAFNVPPIPTVPQGAEVEDGSGIRIKSVIFLLISFLKFLYFKKTVNWLLLNIRLNI